MIIDHVWPFDEYAILFAELVFPPTIQFDPDHATLRPDTILVVVADHDIPSLDDAIVFVPAPTATHEFCPHAIPNPVVENVVLPNHIKEKKDYTKIKKNKNNNYELFVSDHFGVMSTFTFS